MSSHPSLLGPRPNNGILIIRRNPENESEMYRDRNRERDWGRERDRSRERDRLRDRPSYIDYCNSTRNGSYCHKLKCILKHPRGYVPGPRTKCNFYPNCRYIECKFGHWEGSVCPYSNGDFIPNLDIKSTINIPIITTMPKILKQQVWNKRYGEHAGIGYCFCCRHTIIRQDDFQAGHVTARSKGGTTTIDNLEPICARCNNDMKTMNLYEYQAKFHPLAENVARLLEDATR